MTLLGRVRDAVKGIRDAAFPLTRHDHPLWKAARSLDDLCELTARWLEGGITSQPGYYGTVDVDEKDVPGLAGTLARLNRAGYLTRTSQAGLDRENLRGQRLLQHAAVDGFALEATAARLRQVVDGTGYEIVVHECKPSLWRSGACGVAVTYVDGEPVTTFGRPVSMVAILDNFAGCSRRAVDAVCAAHRVTVYDPVPGRNDLWAVLRDACLDDAAGGRTSAVEEEALRRLGEATDVASTRAAVAGLDHDELHRLAQRLGAHISPDDDETTRHNICAVHNRRRHDTEIINQATTGGPVDPYQLETAVRRVTRDRDAPPDLKAAAASLHAMAVPEENTVDAATRLVNARTGEEANAVLAFRGWTELREIAHVLGMDASSAENCLALREQVLRTVSHARAQHPDDQDRQEAHRQHRLSLMRPPVAPAAVPSMDPYEARQGLARALEDLCSHISTCEAHVAGEGCQACQAHGEAVDTWSATCRGNMERHEVSTPAADAAGPRGTTGQRWYGGGTSHDRAPREARTAVAGQRAPQSGMDGAGTDSGVDTPVATARTPPTTLKTTRTGCDL